MNTIKTGIRIGLMDHLAHNNRLCLMNCGLQTAVLGNLPLQSCQMYSVVLN